MYVGGVSLHAVRFYGEVTVTPPRPKFPPPWLRWCGERFLRVGVEQFIRAILENYWLFLRRRAIRAGV